MQLKITTKREDGILYEETFHNIYEVDIDGSILQYSYLGTPFDKKEFPSLIEKRFNTINMKEKEVVRIEVSGPVEGVWMI